MPTPRPLAPPKVGDSFVQIEVAPNTVVAAQKQAVATVLPKGTLKAI